MAKTRMKTQRTIGLLLVHGVGRQEPLELLNQFESEVLGKPGIRDEDRASSAHRLPDRTLHLYEVYWADILSGPPVIGSFDYRDAAKLSWFPLLNLVTGTYRNPRYPGWLVFCLTLALIPSGLVLAAMYWGAGLFAVMVGSDSKWFLRLHETLDEYAGDVANYTNSAGGARPESSLASCSKDVLERFDRALLAAIEDDCDEIFVLAHSLGSVIMYHGLTRQDLGASITTALSRIRAVFTIGSPLEKISFFWPKLVGAAGPPPQDGQVIEWLNFHGWPDFVSGDLGRFKDATAGWAVIEPIQLRGLGGIATAHSSYARHPKFQEHVTGRLLERPFSTPLRWSERAGLIGHSIRENLAVLVIIPVVFGAGIYAMSLGGALLALVFLTAYVLLFEGDWSILALADSLRWAVVPLGLVCIVSFLAAAKEHRERWRTGKKKTDHPDA